MHRESRHRLLPRWCRLAVLGGVRRCRCDLAVAAVARRAAAARCCARSRWRCGAGARQPVAHARGPRAVPAVAAVIVDKSPSQNLGDRDAADRGRPRRADASGSSAFRGLEVRIVEAGAADGETDGTRLFAALADARRCAARPRRRRDPRHRRPRARRAGRCRRARLRRAAACADHRPARTRRDRRVVLDTAPRFGIVGQTQTIALPRRGPRRRPARPARSPCGATARSRRPQRDGPVSRRASCNVPIPHAGPNIVEIEARRSTAS